MFRAASNSFGHQQRIKSAKVLVKEGPYANCRPGKAPTSLKQIIAKTSAQQKELEYRLVYKKSQGGMKSSNMLLKLMNQNISENIANNPYAKEIQMTGGVQIKAVGKKNSVSHVGGHTVENHRKLNRFFSAVGNRSSDDDMDASTQPPRTERGEHQMSIEGSVAVSNAMYRTQSEFYNIPMD